MISTFLSLIYMHGYTQFDVRMAHYFDVFLIFMDKFVGCNFIQMLSYEVPNLDEYSI